MNINIYIYIYIYILLFLTGIMRDVTYKENDIRTKTECH